MQTIFTISEAARVCKVSPRTVSQWFDAGRIRGYRIPGTNERKIPREHLLKFLMDHGMPTDELLRDAGEVVAAQ